MKTLYKNVTVYSENDSYKADILVDGTDIADVGADLNCDADLIYDCTGLAALPASQAVLLRRQADLRQCAVCPTQSLCATALRLPVTLWIRQRLQALRYILCVP